jgi:DUF1680 family protein
MAALNISIAAAIEPSNPADWKPVRYPAVAPKAGVTLDGGLFHRVFENNIAYLMNSFSTNDILWEFRVRAGKPAPKDREPVSFWVSDLHGSNAGRFLMGAGNALRWEDRKDLRKKLDDVIAGIKECSKPDGYILAFEPEGFLHNEQANYARAWFTYGLIEAGFSGNADAFPLLRGHADWFNHCEYLPKLLGLSLGLQGHPASTSTYFTPIGKPEDILVAEKYYVQKSWMDKLAAHDPDGVWKYPLNRPHCYEITGFEAYLDHYRATGDKKYLQAMQGAWDLIHEDWELPGGTICICEGRPYPPKSNGIGPKAHPGELCGSVFWVRFNERFHQLYPDVEKYVGEIEKSIYNIGIANQDGAAGIRYHARLMKTKEIGSTINTCCEGQGTRLFGSLPEYIYSIASDGLYVDLFEPSSITVPVGGQNVTVKTQTEFPFGSDVTLKLSSAAPLKWNIRVRVPAWAARPMPILVNGQQVALGQPGSYQPIERTWSSGDTISFTLPMEFKLKQYAGEDHIEGHERYSLEYGPLLLAVLGSLDARLNAVHILQEPSALVAVLKPKVGEPMHFTFATADGTEHEYMPYWQVEKQHFDCYPVLDPVEILGNRTFVRSTKVELRGANTNSVLRNSLDGSEPSVQSVAYGCPLDLDRSAVVKARLFLGDKAVGPVVEEAFRKVPLMTPTIRTGKDGKSLEIRLPQESPELTIRYTVDGTEPNADSPVYKTPLPLPKQSARVRAKTLLTGGAPSPMASFLVDSQAEYPWPMPDVQISDLKAVKATVGWMSAQKDKSITGKPLKVGGKNYAKGMGVHAVSELVYNLKHEYRRFVALAGIDNSAASGTGSVTYEVYADDRMLYETPVLRWGEIWHIDAAIPDGAKQIRLVLTDGGDDYNYDWGDWINAGFVCRQ